MSQNNLVIEHAILPIYHWNLNICVNKLKNSKNPANCIIKRLHGKQITGLNQSLSPDTHTNVVQPKFLACDWGI